MSEDTIQWLLENYEESNNASVSRSDLYSNYIRHCADNKITRVNTASFGKILRSVFSGLQTRGFEKRENAKYHYYGIRVKPESTLNNPDRRNDFTKEPNENQNGHSVSEEIEIHEKFKELKEKYFSGSTIFEYLGEGLPQVLLASQLPIDYTSEDLQILGSLYPLPGSAITYSNVNHDFSIGPGKNSSELNNVSEDSEKLENFEAKYLDESKIHEYLGEGSDAIPEFPEISLETQLPVDCTFEDIETFRSLYREHCDSILNALLYLDFTFVETLWKTFWHNNSSNEYEVEKFLSKQKLLALCALKPVQKFIYDIDKQFYRNLIEVLLPDILRPLPNILAQSIQNFAKNLECWISSAMVGWPQTILNVKLKAISSFSNSLLRYVSFNELAQESRIVLHDRNRINQMLSDLNQIDFNNIKSQILWICEFDYELVSHIAQQFKLQLKELNTLEQWACYMKCEMQIVLKPFEGKSNYSQMANQFLLKWSFYSSMVTRELTLNLASSFGSFQLIRMVCVEYMFYLVHHEFN